MLVTINLQTVIPSTSENTKAIFYIQGWKGLIVFCQNILPP